MTTTAASEIPFFNVQLEESNAEESVIKLAKKVFGENKIISAKPLSGGATNVLFKLKIFASQEDCDATRNEFNALVRINGNGTEHIIDRQRESILLAKAEQHGQAPKQYARFANGLVYEFFPGRNLLPHELGTFRKQIAHTFGKFHAIEIEFDKEPLLFKTLYQWIEEVKTHIKFDNVKEAEKAKLFKSIDLQGIEQEVKEWEQILKGWPVVFCHNDALALNIVYNEEKDDVKLIDYEYCGYNYQAFDIGNHFCEYAGFDVNIEHYPTKEVQLDYLRTYLESYHSNHHDNVTVVTDEEVETLYKQVNKAGILANLFWALWGIVQSKYSQIDFNYLEYSIQRLNWYYSWKEKVKAL